MKTQKLKLFSLFLFFCLAPLFSQEYVTGAILDSVRYEQADAKPVLVSRNYSSIPKAYSLKQFSPIPESQGQFGTCVGWSTAFAARTISESVALKRTDRTASSSNVFSPTHVYKNISDNEGRNGANIGRALDFIRDKGVVKRPDTEKTMYLIGNFSGIPLSLFNNARLFPISGYVRLFSNPRGVPGTIEERIPPVKKSLAEGRPVVIGMNCPESFFRAKDVWRPTENQNREYGGHAMCVVGYDDNMHGGAFEIQNSWGTKWGNGGYIWIRYQDFANWVGEAYEIIENLANYKERTQFAASIKIEVLNNARSMPVSYDRQGFYKTRSPHLTGTQFRFLMTNRYPAYVYAFSADSYSSDIERIFPMHGVSAVLDYTDSTVAWPGENTDMALFGASGSDYLVVLYSKEALNIGEIERRFANERGAFPERVARAVGPNFIPYNSVEYNNNEMEFSAVSTNSKAVFGLLLAIDIKAQ